MNKLDSACMCEYYRILALNENYTNDDDLEKITSICSDVWAMVDNDDINENINFYTFVNEFIKKYNLSFCDSRDKYFLQDCIIEKLDFIHKTIVF